MMDIKILIKKLQKVCVILSILFQSSIKSFKIKNKLCKLFILHYMKIL